MITQTSPITASTVDAKTNPHFRSDIEGLRAVAILLVVLSHYGIPGFFAGFIGVDVFFVISGYLITGIVAREIESTGRVNFGRFYANRLRRLLPALALMLFISSLAAYFILPASNNLTQSLAAFAASVWSSNIYFAFADTDYFAIESAKNIFLHTWSLGVEEQFYLIWPLSLLLIRLCAPTRAFNAKLRVALIIFVLASLGTCIFYSQSQPILAFYLMPMRIWEFGAGALVWSVGRNSSKSASKSSAAAWSGLLLLIITMVVINERTVYPGVVAILPVVATCLLLWSGTNTSQASERPASTHIATLLSCGAMQWVGKISYAWYLWHWPVLILGGEYTPIKGHVATASAALGISLLAAIGTTYLLENPIRFGRFARIANVKQIALAFVLMVLLGSQFLRWNVMSQDTLASDFNASIIKASTDTSLVYKSGCDDWYHSSNVKPCSFGNPNASKRVVLIGDSIGVQWFPTLSTMFDSNEWQIIVLTKSSCPMVDESYFYQRIGREYTECSTWRNNAIAWIQQQHFDKVFVGSTASAAFSDQQWIEGTHRILDKLTVNADKVYLIEANPILPFHGLECLLKQSTPDGDRPNCSSPSNNARYEHVSRMLKEVVNKQPGAHWIEVGSFVCPNQVCSARRNNTFVFRDAQHVTATFAAQAAEHFLKQTR